MSFKNNNKSLPLPLYSGVIRTKFFYVQEALGKILCSLGGILKCE